MLHGASNVTILMTCSNFTLKIDTSTFTVFVLIFITCIYFKLYNQSSPGNVIDFLITPVKCIDCLHQSTSVKRRP